MPHVDHGLHHFAADVHQLVRRRDRESSLPCAGFCSPGSGILSRPAIPFGFDAVEVEIARVGVLVEADVVENEELGFGAEVRGVGDAGAASGRSTALRAMLRGSRL